MCQAVTPAVPGSSPCDNNLTAQTLGGFRKEGGDVPPCQCAYGTHPFRCQHSVYYSVGACWRSGLGRIHMGTQHQLLRCRGVFGCHTAFVLRRLRRLCERFYKARPTFVVTSATVANPREHVQELLGESGWIFHNSQSEARHCMFCPQMPTGPLSQPSPTRNLSLVSALCDNTRSIYLCFCVHR